MIAYYEKFMTQLDMKMLWWMLELNGLNFVNEKAILEGFWMRSMRILCNIMELADFEESSMVVF